MRNDNTLGPLASVQVIISRAGLRKTVTRSGSVFSTIFFALMILALLALLFVGVNAYRTANDTRTAGNEMRIGLSLIGNSIRANDVVDAVGAGTGPEGRSLVMTETLESGSFETRIYAYRGSIVEEYAAAGSAYTPERAREIVASEVFDFEYRNGLLTVYTDQGAASVALRSVSGGA